jgi:hypothetical protein
MQAPMGDLGDDGSNTTRCCQQSGAFEMLLLDGGSNMFSAFQTLLNGLLHAADR